VKLLRIVLPIFCLVAFSVSILGQQFTSISGRVRDANGAAISGAKVTLTAADTRASRTVTTDEAGAYQFRQFRPGLYSLKIESAGFKTFEHERVELLVATPATIDVTMQPGAISEQIVISERTSSGVNTQDASAGNPLNERAIKNLPILARNPVTLLTLQPGVVFTGESDTDRLSQGANKNLDDREGFVNGLRANQTNVTVDGANANDFETQAAFSSTLPVTLDSLQEFRVTTANAGATEGVAGGAQVQLVTKSGSNSFHGNLREYHRNTATAANSYFNNLASIEKPKLLRNIFGGSLGGRLVRDRAFFFFDYEGRRDASEESADRIVPSDSLREGVLKYVANNGQVVTLDAATLKTLDPAGLGVNQAMLGYFAQYPQGNNPGASPDGNLNYNSFRFNAPIRTDNNIYTARFDYNLTADGRHTLFWRGTLGDIKTTLTPQQFPGAPVSAELLNNSKGFVIGWTGAFTSRFVNSFRYALTRQGIEETGAVGEYFNVIRITPFFPGALENGAFPADPKGRRVPIHEFSNDATWTAGAHTLQFGGLARFSRNERFDQGFAYPYYNVSAPDCVNGCRAAFDNLMAMNGANTGANPANVSGFAADYVLLAGAIPSIRAAFQTDPRNNSILPQGNGRSRKFAEDGFELYAQHSWRIRPNLNLLAGLRYSYYTPIWEVDGRMLRPNFDVGAWWENRKENTLKGIPSDASPLIGYDLAGKANGQPAWYAPDKNNFAPRVSLAWSPDFKSGFLKTVFGESGKSAIRIGSGVYFQRFGSALAITTDRWGNPGLSSLLFSPRNQFDLANAPRFSGTCAITGCAGMPAITNYLTPPDALSLPFMPAADGSNFHFMVDSNLTTPYSFHNTFSVQRELPGRLTLEVAYIGTLGRRLLNKMDLAAPLNYLIDTTSGQTLWGAYRQVAGLIGADPFNPAIDPNNAAALKTIAPVTFFQNMLPNLPAFLGRPDLTPTQAFYLMAAGSGGLWSDPLFILDSPNEGGVSAWNNQVDPQRDGRVLFQPQYFFLPTWFNSGSSDYHSAQISVRRNVGGAQFGFNYVLSKSLDNGSAAENASLNNGTFWPSTGTVANPFRPGAHRALSDYDLRHNFNAYWVVDLPFGQRRKLSGGKFLNALIGGWTTTGVFRTRSGFPISADGNDSYFTTYATVAPGLNSYIVRDGAGGRPNLFLSPAKAKELLLYTPPGEVGSRNAIRGPGYVNVDLGFAKRFAMPWNERHNVEFRTTIFNAFNHANFSIRPPNYDHNFSLLYDPPPVGSFGQLGPINAPREGAREIEFALRFSF
jgi:hypothetical protein